MATRSNNSGVQRGKDVSNKAAADGLSTARNANKAAARNANKAAGSGGKDVSNKAAGDVVPPLRNVHSLQALTRLRPIRGAEYGVVAFVLNRDMIQPDGTLDDLHGLHFYLGSFDNMDAAEAHAEKIIETTGHPAVVAVRYGYPLSLTPKFDPKMVKEITVDMKGKLMKLESDQYKRENEEFEKKVLQEREIMQEAEEETDPDSIEHFKRQCFLAIKNRSKYQVLSKEADAAWAEYKRREATVRDHFAKYPDHEANWLPHLKQKLIERGESQLYSAMELAYSELRDELLGLTEDCTSDENISNECPSNSLSNESISNECLSNNNLSNECPGGVCYGSINPGVVELSSEDDIIAETSLDELKIEVAVSPEPVIVSSDSDIIAPPSDDDIVLTPPPSSTRGKKTNTRIVRGRRGIRR